MRDRITHIGKSTIQHGKVSNRIYLMKLESGEAAELLPQLDDLAREKGYTKIFAKIPATLWPFFLVNGYVIEATIPDFFDDGSDCLLVARFFDEKRQKVPAKELEMMNELLTKARSNGKAKGSEQSTLTAKRLHEKHVGAITAIFRQVFETYPFPVYDPDYVLQTMQEGEAQYFGILEDNKLIGVSTAEIDAQNACAEMTDFAVLTEHRGKRLAQRLLAHMEKAMKASGITTCYTIARLNQPGMNKTFLNLGYKYTGTLINNTNIGGSIESMNILYKQL